MWPSLTFWGNANAWQLWDRCRLSAKMHRHLKSKRPAPSARYSSSCAFSTNARLAELKWAVVVQELARKQQEEQREIKARMRDEEKARREYEQKMREAAKSAGH